MNFDILLNFSLTRSATVNCKLKVVLLYDVVCGVVMTCDSHVIHVLNLKKVLLTDALSPSMDVLETIAPLFRVSHAFPCVVLRVFFHVDIMSFLMTWTL